MSKNKKIAFDRKVRKDGSTNPKYVDLLEVDKPIAGQGYGCFSFITPEVLQFHFRPPSSSPVRSYHSKCKSSLKLHESIL